MFEDTRRYFPFFCYFVWVFNRVFSMILFYFIVAKCLFTIGCFPFLQCHPRVPRYYWFPSFAPLSIRANVVPATLVSGPFLVSQIYFFWYFFSKSLLLTFRYGVSLESWLLISLPSRFLNLTFLDSVFLMSFLLSFSRVSRFHPWQVESFPSYLLSEFCEVSAPCP